MDLYKEVRRVAISEGNPLADLAGSLIIAAADRGNPIIGLHLEMRRLRGQKRVMSDGEAFPEQGGSLYGEGGNREQTFVVNNCLLGFTDVSLSCLN
ncbi:hypothetical protein [Halomonas sp. 11-S5]|uniref:hypothetical protein n=1 Tax=Halomonas sp. 11-S5 TaxID=2994064 RepID=UPI00246911A5|nr:hypothetical protein [Halomonas sp. 11-S5]